MRVAQVDDGLDCSAFDLLLVFIWFSYLCSNIFSTLHLPCSRVGCSRVDFSSGLRCAHAFCELLSFRVDCVTSWIFSSNGSEEPKTIIIFV